MTLIVCIDDKNGMLFGGKRQSRDSLLTERIIKLTEGKRLILSPYSAPLFTDKKDLVVAEDPATVCGQSDFLFVEDTPLPAENVEELLLYRWNRHYPATRFFTLSTDSFTLAETCELKGSSHDRITEERWIKK